MKKKLLLLSLITTLVSTLTFSQKIKIKKGKVFIEGNSALKIERPFLGTKATFYNLVTGKEVLYLSSENNGTLNHSIDDYTILFFSNEHIKVESSRIKGSVKRILKKLVKEQVLNIDGTINSKVIERFVIKYDENITNRTVRYQ